MLNQIAKKIKIRNHQAPLYAVVDVRPLTKPGGDDSFLDCCERSILFSSHRQT